MNCPQCGLPMIVEWEDVLGISYWCTKCSKEVNEPFDNQQTNPTGIHPADTEQEKQE